MEKRAEFVVQACGGDRELRRELEGLLAASDSETGAFDQPVVNLKELFSGAGRIFADGELILGRFRIVSHLGSGGMGEVYEATDLQLGRIALKTIRPGITANQEQLLRFRKEVQLARKVSSPHVCRIHDLHLTETDAEGLQRAFLTMEFLQGTTLTDRIASGPLPWREAVKVILEVCTGLHSIHEAGVIHRDLKGRNIMLASRNGKSCAVLMDFGIAFELRHHTGNTSTTITSDGEIIGTPDYMAPEQFEGKEATPATDVYALGIVLYEALTGRRPFAVPMLEKVSKPSRHRIPLQISLVQPGVPRRFDRVISKCLEYDPMRRYQSAKDLELALRGSPNLFGMQTKPLSFAALLLSLILLLSSALLIPAIRERIQGMLLASREKHIAVLPFDFVGDDPKVEALGDGLMDSLTGKLSSLDAANEALWVIPATEVRHRKVTDPVSALKEFGATIALKGRLETHNQAMHLNLSVIDTKKMRQIGFVELYSQGNDLEGLQNEAVARLGRLINISVKLNDSNDVVSPINQAAYENYLIGTGYMQRFDKPGNLDLAIDALRKSTATDDQFTLGFARLGEAYRLKYQLDKDPKWLEQAQTYCKRAMQLDPRLPAANSTLARIHELSGNHELAVQEFQRALESDPRDADALNGLAHSYQNAGQSSAAEATYIKAAAVRPDDWSGYNNLGNYYDERGKHRDAIVQYQHGLERTPDNSVLLANLGGAYLVSDDPMMLGRAEQALRRSIAVSPNYVAYANLGNLYEMQHRFLDSAIATEQALQIDDQDYDVWNNLAEVYEVLGNHEKANECRRKTVELAERTVKMNPQDANAQALLGALFAHTGSTEKAMAYIKSSLALSPNDPYVLSEVAGAYGSLGRRSQAMNYIRKAVKHGYALEQLRNDPALHGVFQDPDFRIAEK